MRRSRIVVVLLCLLGLVVAGQLLTEPAQARPRSRRLPPGTAGAVAPAHPTAHSYAHDQRDERALPLGIVHRDVTPANVLVGQDGAVKLIDFGIAKAVARTSNTQTGVVKGKAGYMAPEQVLNHPIDARTDVFALGIVLYELTTQERLFAGATDYESAQRCVAADVPRPSLVVRGYPHALEEVVLTALSREPGGRFASARAMGAALVDAAKTDGLDARPEIVERVIGALFGKRADPWQRIIPTTKAEEEDEEGTTERLPVKEPELASPPSQELPLPAPTEPMPAARPEASSESEPSWLDPSAPEPIDLPVRPTGHANAPPSIRWPRPTVARWAAVAVAIGAVVGLVASVTVPDVQPVSSVERELARTQPPPQPPPPPPPQPPPQPAVASIPPPPLPVARCSLPDARCAITISVTTTPDDATLVIDGHRMGHTPFTGTFTPRGDTVWLKVRKRGHISRKVKVPVTPDVAWTVQLAPRGH
jgi:serine/threonine-protein kinase